ncbi:MAG: hypothetical protein IKE65_03185, partial [Clostridia bacterium]|nr:hypothetical protein [Clostridia bacterium]
RTLTASHLPFLANLSNFSLIGASQSASILKKLSQKFLRERCVAVLVSLFCTKIRQNDEGMLTHCEAF